MDITILRSTSSALLHGDTLLDEVLEHVARTRGIEISKSLGIVGCYDTLFFEQEFDPFIGCVICSGLQGLIWH